VAGQYLKSKRRLLPVDGRDIKDKWRVLPVVGPFDFQDET